MDGQRFDGFTKMLAKLSSRRTALRSAGGGGLAALLVAGAGQRAAVAQETTTVADSVCIANFQATIRQGPSAGEDLRGALVLEIGAEGQIDRGGLVRGDGSVVPVVGQSNGRAVNLLFTVDEGSYLYGVGVAENDLRACAGPMGGPLVGPQPGDMGDWDFCCCPNAFTDCTGAGDQTPCDGCGDDVIPILPVGTEVCILNCPPRFRRNMDECFQDCVSFS